jgi:hypothetical protein
MIRLTKSKRTLTRVSDGQQLDPMAKQIRTIPASRRTSFRSLPAAVSRFWRTTMLTVTSPRGANGSSHGFVSHWFFRIEQLNRALLSEKVAWMLAANRASGKGGAYAGEESPRRPSGRERSQRTRTRHATSTPDAAGATPHSKWHLACSVPV